MHRVSRWGSNSAVHQSTINPRYNPNTVDGRGATGRHLKSWIDYAKENIDAIGHAYDWWKTCKDREDSKEIIHVLLNVRSPQDRKTCNNNKRGWILRGL